MIRNYGMILAAIALIGCVTTPAVAGDRVLLLEETSYDGYDGIMRGIVIRMLDETRKYIDKGK
jgi:hypothetical protein